MAKKIRKYNLGGEEGWNDRIVAIMPLNNFSRREIKRSARGAARNEELAQEIINKQVLVGGDNRREERYFNRQFNKERNRIAKENRLKEIKQQASEMMSSDAWKTIPIRQGENFEANKHAREYVKDINNAAIGGIGGALLATNPFTTELALEALQGAGHGTHVLLDPLAANTMFGTFLGTLGQAAGITTGIYNAANTIDKWRSGNFNWHDIPYFALDATSAIPVINTMYGLTDDAIRMAQNMYRTQKAARNATKSIAHGDPVLAQEYINVAGNAMEPVQTNPRMVNIYNQQITGKLASRNPSKLTEAEIQGLSKHDRTNVDRVMEKVKKAFSQENRVSSSSMNPSQQQYVEEIADALNSGKKPQITPFDHSNKLDLFGIMNSADRPAVYNPHRLQTFAKTLPPVDPNIPELQILKHDSLWGAFYRGYLRKLGYDVWDISSDDMSKLAYNGYMELKNGIRGKGKDILLYHGVNKSQKPLVSYNTNQQGINTNNFGRSGPGFYLSNVPGYSGPNARYNIQPYMINNIEEVIPATQLGYIGKKGSNIKDYITDLSVQAEQLGVSKQELISRLIKLYPDESKYLVLDPFESTKPTFAGFLEPESFDARYRGPSQNIKSIFPHPNRYRLQPNGTVILKPTDWNDPRFNFKYGGKMKNKSNKKMLGAAIIGAASSLIGAGIQAANQRKLYEQQQADQRKLQNIQNTNAMINNLNQQANNNMDWAYDKFKPTFKLGGTQSKFKNRF